MLNSYEKRIDWIDECKGLAIILVVFGHCWSRDVTVFRWVCSFHLPIFFIIAGYLMVEKNTIFSKEIIIKKTKRLLVPYFIFSFLIMLTIGLLKMLGGSPVNTFFLNETKSILKLRANIPTWFLACIFISEVIYLLMLKLTKGKMYLRILFDLICALLVFHMEKNIAVIFMLRRSLLGVLWMEIGQLIYQFHKRNYKFSWIINSIAFLSNVVLSIYNEKVDMMLLEFGKSKVVYLVIGIMGSLTLMELFRNFKKSIRMLIFLGKHSMEILCSHTFVIEAVRLIDYKLLGNFISSKTNFEGYILTAIVLLLEIPVIWILNTYFPWSIGKQSKQIRLNN